MTKAEKKKLSNQRLYLKNREKRLEYQKQWYIDNKEQYIEYRKKYAKNKIEEGE